MLVSDDAYGDPWQPGVNCSFRTTQLIRKPFAWVDSFSPARILAHLIHWYMPFGANVYSTLWKLVHNGIEGFLGNMATRFGELRVSPVS